MRVLICGILRREGSYIVSSDVQVINSLISMHSQCKKIDMAAKIFENFPGKTPVSWNAMILRYS